MRRTLLTVLITTLLLSGCAAIAPDRVPSAPRPRVEGAAPTGNRGVPLNAPGAQEPGPQAVSGGLGLSRADWEAKYGQAGRTVEGHNAYQDGALLVGFGDDNVWRIERRWPESAPVTVDRAREEARRLMPRDAEPIGTDTLPNGANVEMFRSAWLADRFPLMVPAGRNFISPWAGAEAGTFQVIYRPSANGIRSVALAIGNNT